MAVLALLLRDEERDEHKDEEADFTNSEGAGSFLNLMEFADQKFVSLKAVNFAVVEGNWHVE
jgi:hypothetical protein